MGVFVCAYIYMGKICVYTYSMSECMHKFAAESASAAPGGAPTFQRRYDSLVRVSQFG